MNPFTEQFISDLWVGEPSFGTVEERVKLRCKSFSVPEAAVIGRDLLIRKQNLCSKVFKLAAWLATSGEAAEEDFLDFIDCVSFLPELRYRACLENPDDIAGEPITKAYGEHYLMREVCNVFDRGLFEGEEDEHFLDYLVLGEDSVDWKELSDYDEDFAKQHLPKLYSRFWKELHDETSIQAEDSVSSSPHPDRIRLSDLIPDLDDSGH